MYIVANMKKNGIPIFKELTTTSTSNRIQKSQATTRMEKSLIQVAKTSYGNKHLIVQIHRDSKLSS